ncbi:transposase [Roseofilum reptotaenium CS-1145]|nr:transposase [Roseofilum reptotaenium]MDB9516583.1 transposase [Roseofilum reptotaenium CS-1145]
MYLIARGYSNYTAMVCYLDVFDPLTKSVFCVDFTQIDGLGVLTVQTILSEVALDPSRFPSVKHFCSWLGLSPGSCITGGKIKISRTHRVVNRAANAFRMAAQALKNSRSLWGLSLVVCAID